MTRKMDKRLVDANTIVMGSGVGLAALEAMFNMVNAQSLVTANMIKHNDLSHPLQMEALAQAMALIIAAAEDCGGGEGYANAPVRVPPPQQNGGAGPLLGAALPPSNTTENLASRLKNVRRGGNNDGEDKVERSVDRNVDAENANINLGTYSSSQENAADIDRLFSELLLMFSKHMTELVESGKPSVPPLMVT